MRTLRGIKFLFLIWLGVGLIPLSAQETGGKKAVQSFPLSAVRLLESPFKKAEQTDLDYILALDPDRLLAPYLREAGLEPKAESYGNWESSGLDGHIGGHYLTALSLMYASTGNKEVQDRLNYMLDELKRAQDKNGNGYIAGVPGGEEMWKEVAAGNIDAGNFSLNEKWVPWYNIHKLFAGLRDAWLYTGSEQAKEMLVKLTDWNMELVENLSEEQIQDMLRSEHGGMNEVFADVAVITGEDKYLELARKFSHQAILDPLLQHQDKLNGLHANTQIPKVIGFQRIAEVAGDSDWHGAAKYFWETVVNNRSVAIGGNSVREHFHPADDFSTMIADREGPETCNTYNMLKLSKLLYESESATEFIDFYERGLYNHILSSQHPEKGGFVYFTPMRPNHYRVYSQPENGFWCCVGSGLENHAKYGELIYAHTEDELFVNLFIPSALQWKEKQLSLTQQTRFPEEEKTVLKIEEAKPSKFTLKLRYPSWVKAGELKVKVNGKETKVAAKPGEYISINRKWKKGDVIEVKLPMETKLEQLPDGSPYFAVVHGPIVMAAKTSVNDLEGLYADAGRMGHIAAGELVPLQESPMFVSTEKEMATKIKAVEGKPLTFTASELIYPAKFKDTELVPFYTIHDARYVLYWPHATPAGLDSLQQVIREQEKVKAALEQLTVDAVAPGEQQPESDHFFKGEKTESGIFKNRHWRHAHGWFSYQLKDKNREARLLRVTYSGLDKDREFDIMINDTKIATVRLDGSQGDKFFSVDYPLPPELVENAENNTLVTKFVARPGSMAGGIFDVRLLKEDK